jgi:hypothetical protein
MLPGDNSMTVSGYSSEYSDAETIPAACLPTRYKRSAK